MTMKWISSWKMNADRNWGSKIVEIWFTYNVIEYKMTLYTQVTQNTHEVISILFHIILIVSYIFNAPQFLFKIQIYSKCIVYWCLINTFCYSIQILAIVYCIVYHIFHPTSIHLSWPSSTTKAQNSNGNLNILRYLQ